MSLTRLKITSFTLSTVLVAGCGGLFKAVVPSASGANPVSSGAPLTIALRPYDYPGYDCKPGRVKLQYELSAASDQLCVKFSTGQMRNVGQGPPTIGPMKVTFTVDGKKSQPFDLTPEGRPGIGAECSSKNGPSVEWVIDAKGCLKNDGLLTEKSASAELIAADGSPYARFKFAGGAVSEAKPETAAN